MASLPRIRNPKSEILFVNRPCSVMVRETDNGLRVSVASTDMDAWDPWGSGRIHLSGDIVLTLAGNWNAAGAEVAVEKRAGETVLRIPFRTFMPVVATLTRPKLEESGSPISSTGLRDGLFGVRERACPGGSPEGEDGSSRFLPGEAQLRLPKAADRAAALCMLPSQADLRPACVATKRNAIDTIA
jgi:hypothetical protein